MAPFNSTQQKQAIAQFQAFIPQADKKVAEKVRKTRLRMRRKRERVMSGGGMS